MNVLILGSGGREHALAWKISRSPRLSRLYIAPGNAGTTVDGQNVELDASDFAGVKDFCLEKEIAMVVVGPEAPLVAGIHDFFLNDPGISHIAVIGPTRQAAMLEGSKDFAKNFMKKYNIPTADFQTFTKDDLDDALDYLRSLEAPFVLKADGLAAGKGVLIHDSLESAELALKAMLVDRKFGEASSKVVIEQHLKGVEVSVFILTDGNSWLLLPPAKDYKRIGDGDTGPNTGGMGSISAVPFADEAFMTKVEASIIRPTMEGLISEGIEYRGFLFFGLMNVEGNPYVIEYNVRMGDPEAESIIPRIRTDLLELLDGVANGNLDTKSLEVDERFNAAVFLVSGGYPGSYDKGKPIKGINKAENCLLFHAGTAVDPINNNVVTNGGRVLAISSFGKTIREALDNCYHNAGRIHFDGKYFRSDLGEDIMSH